MVEKKLLTDCNKESKGVEKTVLKKLNKGKGKLRKACHFLKICTVAKISFLDIRTL